MQVFIDGKFYDEKDAKISIFDHGFLYGNGAFTTLMTHEKRIFFVDDHIDRLFESAEIIRIKAPWSKQQVLEWLDETYQRNMAETGRQRIRINISRGVGPDVVIERNQDCKPSISILVSKYPEMSAEVAKDGLKVSVVDVERVFPKSKNFNFLPSIFALQEAKDAGFNDAFLKNRMGHVTEATTGNIFYFKDGDLFTTSSQILEGVTRKHVIRIAREVGMRVTEKMFRLGDLLNADEVFVAGTTKLIIPVRQIDDRVISNGSWGHRTREFHQILTEKIFNDPDEKYFHRPGSIKKTHGGVEK